MHNSGKSRRILPVGILKSCVFIFTLRRHGSCAFPHLFQIVTDSQTAGFCPVTVREVIRAVGPVSVPSSRICAHIPFPAPAVRCGASGSSIPATEGRSPVRIIPHPFPEFNAFPAPRAGFGFRSTLYGMQGGCRKTVLKGFFRRFALKLSITAFN